MGINEYVMSMYACALDIAHGIVTWVFRAPRTVLENALAEGGFRIEETDPSGSVWYRNDAGEYACVEHV